MKIRFALLVTAGGLALVSSIAVAQEQSAKFKISLRKTDDTAKVEGTAERTVFAIQSASGIGQAVIERRENHWPKQMLIHLHLGGLENFRVASGKLAVQAAFSTQDGKVLLWKDEAGEPAIEPGSPLFIEIRRVGGSKKGAPSEYFEIALPPALFGEEAQAMTIGWIDFYR